MRLSEDLTYEEYPVAIVDRHIRQLCTKGIPMVKILCSNHTVEDCMWEQEAVCEAHTLIFCLAKLVILTVLLKFGDEFL